MRKIMLLIMSLMVGSAFAASTHLSLDNRTGMRVANATERICFSPAWETDAAGATAVVSTNGVAVKSATEAGVFDWTPAQDGIYQLTHAVYVNGVQMGETLTATFVKGVAPRGCDWSTGMIELGWYADAKSLNAITYNIYWSESDDPASCVGKTDHRVGTKDFAPSKIGVQELTISDDKYLTHGDGLKPIYYHVVGTDGSKSFCKTRNRYGIFYGLGKYDKSKFPKLTEKENRGTSASKFAELMLENGGMENGNAYTRINADATLGRLTDDFSYISSVIKTGDILVFFCSTHGARVASGRAAVCLYDDHLTNDRLATLLKQVDGAVLGKSRGVALINVIAACHSGGFFEADGAGEWYLDHDLAYCTANAGWISSAGYDTSVVEAK